LGPEGPKIGFYASKTPRFGEGPGSQFVLKPEKSPPKNRENFPKTVVFGPEWSFWGTKRIEFTPPGLNTKICRYWDMTPS